MDLVEKLKDHTKTRENLQDHDRQSQLNRRREYAGGRRRRRRWVTTEGDVGSESLSPPNDLDESRVCSWPGCYSTSKQRRREGIRESAFWAPRNVAQTATVRESRDESAGMHQ